MAPETKNVPLPEIGKNSDINLAHVALESSKKLPFSVDMVGGQNEVCLEVGATGLFEIDWIESKHRLE